MQGFKFSPVCLGFLNKKLAICCAPENGASKTGKKYEMRNCKSNTYDTKPYKLCQKHNLKYYMSFNFRQLKTRDDL